MDYDEDAEDVDYDDKQNELPNPQDPEEDEIPLWEEISENEIHDLLNDQAPDLDQAQNEHDPIQAIPDEQVDNEVGEQEEVVTQAEEEVGNEQEGEQIAPQQDTGQPPEDESVEPERP